MSGQTQMLGGGRMLVSMDNTRSNTDSPCYGPNLVEDLEGQGLGDSGIQLSNIEESRRRRL